MKRIFLSLICALLCSLGVMAETLTLTSAEIQSGQTSNGIALGTNAYGSQDVTNSNTWYTFAKNNFNFTGARICKSAATNGSVIQLQGGEDTDAAKQGFLGNTTSFEKITNISIKIRNTSNNNYTYTPAFNVYVGSTQLPSTNALTLSPTNSTIDGINYYVYTINVTGSNGYFAIRNNRAGALYIAEISITYEAAGTTPEPTTYSVSVANNIANGTVSASATSAAAGAEVTLTATPATGYEFGSWNVTNASTSAAITVTNNKFTMPAANVNVSATFNQIQQGGDETTVTWIAKDQNYTNGVQYTSATVDDNISLAFGDGGNDGKYYDTGTGIRLYANGKLTVSAASGYMISNIIITYSADSYTGTFSANTGEYTLSTATGTWTGSANSVVFTNTATSGHARIQKIVVTYAAADVPTLSSIAVSGTPTKTAYQVGDVFNPEGLIVTGTYSDNSTATFSSGITWTVTPSTGLTIGTTSVSVVATVDEISSPAYTVNGLTVSAIPVYTSLEALAAADLTSGNKVTVSFENVAIKEIYVTTPRNEGDPVYRNGIFFNIQKGGKDIEIYYQNVPEEWVVGGTVSGTMTCPWKNFNGTWELAPASGWAWTNLTYTAPAKNTPTITATYATELTVGDAANVFEVNYNGDGELSVVSSASGIASASINAEGNVTVTPVAAGIAEITISTSETDNYHAAELKYTVTVKEAQVLTPAEDGQEKVDFRTIAPYKDVVSGGSAAVEDYVGTSFAMEFSKPQSSTTPTKYYDKGQAVRAYIGNTITITGAENITGVNVNYVEDYFDYAATTEGLGTTTVVITFSGTCRFTDITVYYQTSSLNLVATDGANYWATFSSDKAVEFADATVYTVTVNEGVMSLNEVESKKVPANTGVLLKSASNAVSFNYIASAARQLNNDLHPASEEMAGEYNFYKLAYNNYTAKTGLGFYFGAANGAAFTCKEGTAYLAVSLDNAGVQTHFLLEDEVTAVENVEATDVVKFIENGVLYIQKNGRVYNAMGQLVK